MEFIKFLCRVDGDVLESESDLIDVSFSKVQLVAYYEANYDTVEPAKKIFYFKKPKPENYPINLNDGFHRYIGWHSSSLDRKKCLKFCLKYAMSSDFKRNVENVDKIKIFTQRGALVDLMEGYYYKKYPQILVHVTRYKGQLYMIRHKDYCSNKLKQKEQDDGMDIEPKDTHDAQFRRNVFTESFYNEPNISEPWDANKGLIGVYQSIFGDFEIIYSGPIYGIEADDEFKDFDNLEALNTCRFVMAKQMWSGFKIPAKYLHYWLEALLANAADLYFAYKDSDGIVRKPIVHKLVSDLPKKYTSHWKPSICAQFLYKFLQNINKLMSNDNINCLNTVYEFHVDLETRIITYKIFKDNPELILIPPEYMEYCKEEN